MIAHGVWAMPTTNTDELSLPAIHAYLSGFQIQPGFYGLDTIYGVWSGSRIRITME